MSHYWFSAAILATQSFAIYQLATLGGTMSDQQAQIDNLTAQVIKAGQEVASAHDALVAELADVKDQLANAGVAEQVDLSNLAAAIQQVDDINPDAVAPEEPTA
jgi:hypothetical protein